MDTPGDSFSYVLFCMSYQEYAMVDACRKLLLVVCDHNHCLVLALAECFDDVFYKATVSVVEAMQWLIENQKLWVFYERTCQENKTLLSTGKF